MEKPEDIMMTLAKGMNDVSRSGSNHGQLFLINEILVELTSMDLEKESKACVEVYLQTKKAEIKKDIKRNSKFPDPYLDKL